MSLGPRPSISRARSNHRELLRRQSRKLAKNGDNWTAGEVPVEVDTGIAIACGWIHWSGRIGLYRVRAGKTSDEGGFPYALCHIPSGICGRFYPNMEIANYVANWLCGLEEINRDAPLPLAGVNRVIADSLIEEFQLQVNDNKCWHYFRKASDLSTKS